jgi:hypothetical protein
VGEEKEAKKAVVFNHSSVGDLIKIFLLYPLKRFLDCSCYGIFCLEEWLACSSCTIEV